MELISRYEKIPLLRSECLKRFKDASIMCPIYLLNMLGTRSYLFQNTHNTFSKNTVFANRHQIIYFLLSLEGNESAGTKYPINLKHPENFLVMRTLTQKVEK